MVRNPWTSARRIARVIPEPVLIAVRVEDHRPLAELLFEAIRIELGLLLTDPRILPCPLGLDEAERLAVITPQHIVDEALACVVGHAGDREFPILRLVERPASFVSSRSMKASRVAASL